MNNLIATHSAIMDKYDPEKKIALVVDEWGVWYAALPGSTPGFLAQQNSLRDAILAALNLNIFARHADRVRGANIAQMVNVLQAMILTDKEKMVLTPTYHVFRMYVPFQDATVVPVTFDAGRYTHRDLTLPRVDAIAAKDARRHALDGADQHRPGAADRNQRARVGHGRPDGDRRSPHRRRGGQCEHLRRAEDGHTAGGLGTGAGRSDQRGAAAEVGHGAVGAVTQTTATGFSSAPIPAMAIRTRSPGSSVNESGGTTPAPVSRIAPWGKAWERNRYSTSSANGRLISPA